MSINPKIRTKKSTEVERPECMKNTCSVQSVVKYGQIDFALNAVMSSSKGNRLEVQANHKPSSPSQ